MGDTSSRSPDTPSKETHNFIPKQNVVYNDIPPPPPLHTTEHNYSFTSDGSPSASCHLHHHLPLQAALAHELQTKQQNTFSEFSSLSLSQRHNIKFCNIGSSDTTMTHCQWWVTVLHTNHDDVRDQVVGAPLCFISLLYHIHSLPFHASAPLWVNSQ